MVKSNYKKRLYELVPQLYHTYDRGDGSLKAFLAAIGETLDDMELNISELSGDSFIESCHEWVVPYIGQLIGTKLIETDGNRNRQEVMKTIHWRKRKGTLDALEDMAAGMTGWGVRAAEFFEQLGWSQNLNHLKLDHLQSPDVTDHKRLFLLGSADNGLLHNIDIRRPSGDKGQFQIKNIGFFLSSVALSHYRKVPMRRVFGKPKRFTIEPKRFPVDLFDGTSRFPLSRTIAFKERFKRFGLGQTVDIYSQGVLAATPEMPEWTGTPAVAPTEPYLLNLKDGGGFLPVDWRVGNGEPLKYTITPMVLFESSNKAKLKALGSLDLSVSPLEYVNTFDGSSKVKGRLVIRVTPHPDYNRSFPGMVLKLVSENQMYGVFEGQRDRQKGVYKDRMYCYLPAFCPAAGNSMDFVIDRYGSVYKYIHNGTKKQPGDIELYNSARLERATEGVIYPSRKLTASITALLPIYSLAKRRALQVIDRGQFITSLAPAEGWTINAWSRDNQPGGGVLRLLSSISITSLSDKVFRSEIENKPVNKPGNLIISLHRPTTGQVPEMELIVTDERGKSTLVYLPQVDDLDSAGNFYYVADDGSTYIVNGETIPGGTIVRSTPTTGPEGAFNTDQLGRYSAGQVLPIGDKTPIQHRIPVRCCLNKKISVHPGLLAIDPVIGHVAFAKRERPKMPLSASYYHGMSAYLGAGAYFHNWEIVEEERLIRVSKRSAPDNNRHLRPPGDGIVSRVKIFNTIREAIDEAISKSGMVNEQPLVIQIEDSEIYSETITVNKFMPRGLIIRAAQFQRPLWRGRIIWNAPDTGITPILAFKGLIMAHTPRIRTGRFKEIHFHDCTLLRKILILKAVKGEQDRYPELTIDNCISRGRISIYSYFEIQIKNSALDPAVIYSLAAKRSKVDIERCTILGRVLVKELHASESIFMQRVVVVNPQQGCIRYCRINKSGNILPYTYKCINDPVTFCSTRPWNSGYLKLRRTCNDTVTGWAENGGEIGVYHQADYTLKQKNLMLKFEEYLPVGLTPVLIDIGCDKGNNQQT